MIFDIKRKIRQQEEIKALTNQKFHGKTQEIPLRNAL
jgi:hypothetical protein